MRAKGISMGIPSGEPEGGGMNRPDLPAAGMPPARFPSLIHVWIAALFTAILLRTFLMPVPPNDVWWQLAMGRLIVKTGAIPTYDVFSFTQAGQPYYDQPWLAQVLMYGLHRMGGVPLLLVVQAVLVSLAYAILLLDSLVRRYDLDGLLIDNERQAGLLAAVGRRPEWEVRYGDDRTTYAVRLLAER
jgi:hypothetical protein